MIKNKSTYEIMAPESIGLMHGKNQSGAGRIVLGRHSGRIAVSTRLKELGYDLDLEKLNAVFARFKEVAEKKMGGLEDDELESLVLDQAGSTNQLWEVTGLQVLTGMSGIPTATVKMRGPDGVESYVAATGTGPIDAVYKAIDQIVGLSVILSDYTMKSVSEGIEALASTRVVITPVVGGVNHNNPLIFKERKFTGLGSDIDIVTSSARAYCSAINKLLKWSMRRQPASAENSGSANAIEVNTPEPTLVES
jgi:2-isopropylmalate synthase